MINIFDSDGYYKGGFLKIKLKTIQVKKEFNKNDIIALDEILKLSKDNIIQNNTKYLNYNKYLK